MLVYKNDKDYCVYLEEDGSDLWLSVTNGYCRSYECIVGTTEEDIDIIACLNTAWACFWPSQYIEENLESNADRYRALCVAGDAFQIDRALEMALNSVTE